LKAPRRADGPGVVSVTVFKRVFDSDDFKEVRRRAGEHSWWLDQTFVDINSPKAEAFLTFLAAGDVA
jgi:hypothetical protein